MLGMVNFVLGVAERANAEEEKEAAAARARAANEAALRARAPVKTREVSPSESSIFILSSPKHSFSLFDLHRRRSNAA
jgi:hypothetical protein